MGAFLIGFMVNSSLSSITSHHTHLGSNVAYQRALGAQAPKKPCGPLSPARSQPPKEPGSPPPPPAKKKQAQRNRALSPANTWLAEREEPASPPKKMRTRAASRLQ